MKNILKAIRNMIDGVYNYIDARFGGDSVEALADADLLPAVHDEKGRILTDEHGNVILRY